MEISGRRQGNSHAPGQGFTATSGTAFYKAQVK